MITFTEDKEFQKMADDANSIAENILQVSPECVYVVVIINKRQNGENAMLIEANVDKQDICMLLNKAVEKVSSGAPAFQNIEELN